MRILDLIFPPRCLGCGRVGSYACVACWKRVAWPNPRCPECDRQCVDGITHPYCKRAWGLDGLVSLYRYEGVVKNIVKSIKYRFSYDVTKAFFTAPKGSLREREVFTFLKEGSAIYPIPLHKDRLKWRGFNQSEKLAQVLATTHGWKMVDNLLTRSIKRTPQADINTRTERLQNACGIFSVNSRELIGVELILFDDVWTTGATMKEACKVLKKSGVKKVWGLTIAR